MGIMMNAIWCCIPQRCLKAWSVLATANGLPPSPFELPNGVVRGFQP
ncbi:hypothetical protein EPIR_1003 [Erwinia piriflorinigrans CFBP 5888]|uniref:Uncharacterized protein n=1 Tax=Erwinia piriflorinigrans CFBP 5888 TaxID=1161919 RepID=V5Z4Z7_9GAMM|nr:hypothetical protein EPIR_1003 [Erwinia piriflorinigrans CFBP 5888]